MLAVKFDGGQSHSYHSEQRLYNTIIARNYVQGVLTSGYQRHAFKLCHVSSNS